MSRRVRIASPPMGCTTPPPLAASVPLAGITLQLILDASAKSLHRNFVLEALAVASNGGHGQRLSGSLK